MGPRLLLAPPPLNVGRRRADTDRMAGNGANPLRAAVEQVLDRLRPGLLADGGNVELVGVDEEGVVRLIFQGACIECPAQISTLRLVIEATLRREIPAITQVVPIASS